MTDYIKGKLSKGYNLENSTSDNKSKLSDWEPEYKKRCSVARCKRVPEVLAHVRDNKKVYFTPLCKYHNNQPSTTELSFVKDVYFTNADTMTKFAYDDLIKKSNKKKH